MISSPLPITIHPQVNGVEVNIIQGILGGIICLCSIAQFSVAGLFLVVAGEVFLAISLC